MAQWKEGIEWPPHSMMAWRCGLVWGATCSAVYIWVCNAFVIMQHLVKFSKKLTFARKIFYNTTYIKYLYMCFSIKTNIRNWKYQGYFQWNIVSISELFTWLHWKPSQSAHTIIIKIIIHIMLVDGQRATHFNSPLRAFYMYN